MFNHSIKIGASFGLTSGIITTLGLMVGLSAGTHSKMVVLGGILTIAIADAFSDALGIHVSEESEQRHSAKEIWQSTIAAFLTKFFFALTFVIPVLIFDLTTAIYVSIAWGLLALSTLSYFISTKGKESPWKAVFEHLLIAVIVIVSTYYVGKWIGTMFGEM
jgi:VIT1/CCC1 family predicted Fe2+/Mn2+ transporter